MIIEVKQHNASYSLTEDNEFKCTHEDYDVIEPCCMMTGSSGYIECGCGGMTYVECNNRDCDGVEDYEVDELIDNYNESRS